MNRRQFLMGAGRFAGAALMLPAVPTIFDMGRDTGIGAPPAPFVYTNYGMYSWGPRLPLPVVANYALPDRGGLMVDRGPLGEFMTIMRDMTSAQVAYTLKGVVYSNTQPFRDGRADFVFPDGGRILRVTAT